MTRVTPDQQRRHDQRAERLRRDRMRQSRQRAVLVVGLLALVVAGAAFALRPSAAPVATPAPAAGTTATPIATRTAQAAPAAAHSTRTVEPTAAPSADATKPAKPPAAAATPATLKALRPAPGIKTIVVDKSDQRVTLYTAKGAPVDSFACASGIVYPRIGTYHVYGHRQQSWSLYDDTTFYYFTQFVKSDKGNNIGFHSIPQHPDGSLEGKLGQPVSHGCVRLSKAKAKFLYTWAVTGTRVVVKK